MVEEWLYQVRIRVSRKLGDAIRSEKLTGTCKKIYTISLKHGTKPVCTFDAFSDYCKEAERNGIEKYPLYSWTKSVIETPEKKEKHIKSFAFYTDTEQVYPKELASNLFNDLLPLYKNKLIENLSLIDNNPKNNPQPPKVVDKSARLKN